MADTKAAAAPVFTLAQLEESDKYAAYVDMLRVILAPDKTYTAKEVDDLLDKALAKPVQEEVNP